MQTELKVFHTSYSCPSSISVTSILSVVKENNARLVFPNLTEQLKTYGTFPVSTAIVDVFLKTEAGENKTLHPLHRGEVVRASFTGS